MNSDFEKYFNKMEANKARILHMASQLDESALHWKKSPDIWSAAQVLDHVIFSEQSALDYCGKKLLAGNQIPNASVWNSWKIRLYFWALDSKFRFKAPKPISNPNNDQTFEELTTRWNQTRTDYISFLNNYPEKYLNKAVFRHPLAGRIKLSEMLRFLNVHVIHHQYQITRILERLSQQSA